MYVTCIQVRAISQHTDEELCATSQDLMRQHLNSARNCRILMQVGYTVVYCTSIYGHHQQQLQAQVID